MVIGVGQPIPRIVGDRPFDSLQSRPVMPRDSIKNSFLPPVSPRHRQCAAATNPWILDHQRLVSSKWWTHSYCSYLQVFGSRAPWRCILRQPISHELRIQPSAPQAQTKISCIIPTTFCVESSQFLLRPVPQRSSTTPQNNWPFLSKPFYRLLPNRLSFGITARTLSSDHQKSHTL